MKSKTTERVVDVFGTQFTEISIEPLPGHDLSHWTGNAGFLTQIISEADERPAEAQLNDRYAHGGGFFEFKGFKLVHTETTGGSYLVYPGDPKILEVARCELPLSKEILVLFQGSWLAIIQKFPGPDGRHAKIARVD